MSYLHIMKLWSYYASLKGLNVYYCSLEACNPDRNLYWIVLKIWVSHMSHKVTSFCTPFDCHKMATRCHLPKQQLVKVPGWWAPFQSPSSAWRGRGGRVGDVVRDAKRLETNRVCVKHLQNQTKCPCDLQVSEQAFTVISSFYNGKTLTLT